MITKKILNSQSLRELVVILDNIRSTYNVGAIFRTSDAAGVAKVFCCGITPVPPNAKIVKVALGAEKFVAWEKMTDTWRLLEKLKNQGYYLLALEQGRKAKDVFTDSILVRRKKVALILGPEVKGLSPKILKRVDAQVEIPMYGQKESLNVSVAFGIAIYQLRNMI
jgi:23S rRNA (guanosine2251-2'-O)-methyltransferase